jgi:hypothetical protein
MSDSAFNPGLAHALGAGAPVIVYLQSPKEKIWGLLLSVTTAGVVVRGLDLVVFDEWMRQEARDDERALGPSTLFYPMHRLERMERDETIGSLTSYADRFAQAVGRPVTEARGMAAE